MNKYTYIYSFILIYICARVQGLGGTPPHGYLPHGQDPPPLWGGVGWADGWGAMRGREGEGEDQTFPIL